MATVVDVGNRGSESHPGSMQGGHGLPALVTPICGLQDSHRRLGIPQNGAPSGAPDWEPW
jgi:hypothetical protein